MKAVVGGLIHYFQTDTLLQNHVMWAPSSLALGSESLVRNKWLHYALFASFKEFGSALRVMRILSIFR